MRNRFRKAIDAGDVDQVRQLLTASPSLATTLISWGPMLCPCRSEPLHYLSDAPFNELWSHGRQAELAELLIAAGAPVNGLPSAGETPLHGAASLGEVGVARVLLDHGADIEAVAAYPGVPDGTPLDFAVHFGMVEVIELLADRGAMVLSTRIAAGIGEADRVKQELPGLLGQPAVVSDVLRCAVVCDRREVVDLLLDNGVDINTEIEGATALHWAAWEAKPAMVEHLTHRGADPDSKDAQHRLTAFGWAKHRRGEVGPRWGHDSVCRILATR